MKNLLNNLIFGRDNRLSGALALGLVLSVALGCTCGKSFDFNSNSSSSSNSVFGGDNDSVDDNLAKATVKATTAEFANAISTEDFSGLYNETATEFRSQYTEDQLKNEFRDFIKQKRNLLPILAKAVSIDPEFTDGPSTRSEGSQTVLSASGKYATKPMPVTFKYEYLKREGKWWLLRIEIYVR
jgi:hypothetical protein